MSKRLMLGVLLAVLASAITASVVVVVGQEGGGSEKVPPSKAVEEFIPYALPGTPVAGLPLPVDWGRFRFVAPETELDLVDSFPTPAPGVKKAGHDVRDAATLDDFRDHGLFVEPPYIPAGWELTEAHAETILWDDGSSWDSAFSLYYTRPEYFGITIARRLVAPEGKIRLVANPLGDITYTLSDIRGVPVVFSEDPLHISFVQGNVVTGIEAPLLHLDELIKIADGLIGQAQEGSS
jgi:hypothetical protein